ncbi:hypothetical protein EDB89DRAFT_1858450, partial [Lactarius sanguifluus]
DEATQYLAAYKKSKHLPPTLICERIFKAPGAVLHTAFTSIPRLDRTSFETLRASLLRPDPPALHRFPIPWALSRVFIPPPLCLPRFGLKKVTGPKDAFKQPSRTGTAGEAGEGPQPTSPLLPYGLAAAAA